MKINHLEAMKLIRSAAQMDSPDPLWVGKIEHFSLLCEQGVSKTHIAFLGTAILAKALNRSADLFAIKPEHAPGNVNSFSARTLCHGVWVPMAAEIGISLGVTGREPLNNQPYFRMTRLDDETPIHSGARTAFNYMMGLVQELQLIANENVALAPLQAFIAVRRRYLRTYSDFEGDAFITPSHLTESIMEFVRENAEGGKRAQAVVAGLLDVFAGRSNVQSGRINDPSRNYPGDVCVSSATDQTLFEKAFEVRDKPVTLSDVKIFTRKCLEMGVQETAVVMVSERQEQLKSHELSEWADNLQVGITLFYGWEVFVEQCLFWAALPKASAATHAAEFIHKRLVSVEISSTSIDFWNSLVSSKKRTSPL